MPKFSRTFSVNNDEDEVVFTIGKHDPGEAESTLEAETVIDGVRYSHPHSCSPGQALSALEAIQQEDAEGFYKAKLEAKETIQ